MLSGPQGWAWQLLVGRPAGSAPGLPIGELLLPIQDDPILALSRLEPAFSGRFGADGTQQVDVSPRLLREAGSSGLVACLLLLRDALDEDATGAAPVAAISAAVPIQR